MAHAAERGAPLSQYFGQVGLSSAVNQPPNFNTFTVRVSCSVMVQPSAVEKGCGQDEALLHLVSQGPRLLE